MEDPDFDPLRYEQRKIRGAVRTDFILSAEIIVITLGIVAEQPLLTRALVLAGIALAMTVGVYGLVGAIVKVDDGGLYLVQREGPGLLARLQRLVGRLLLMLAPRLMVSLSVLGTAAMFLVGGGILVHGLHDLEVVSELLTGKAAALAPLAGLTRVLLPQLFAALLGLLVGFLAVLLINTVQRLRA